MHLTKQKKSVLEAYNTVALQSLTDAAADELQENKDEQDISDITVSEMAVHRNRVTLPFKWGVDRNIK